MIDLGAPLRRCFPEGLPEEPEPAPVPPVKPVVSEEEVMEAIFVDPGFDIKTVEVVERGSTAAKAVQQRQGKKEEKEEKEEKEKKEKKERKERKEEGVESEPKSCSVRDGLRGLRERDWAGGSWSSLVEPVEPAERAELSVDERRLLAAARRRSPLPTLRIRGLCRRDALVALEDFVSLHSAAGRRYIRVITGKGIGSRAEPVLKRELVVWCAGEGAQFVHEIAPEREESLEFGGFILALRRSDGPETRYM